jgi:hypothetical protein
VRPETWSPMTLVAKTMAAKAGISGWVSRARNREGFGVRDSETRRPGDSETLAAAGSGAVGSGTVGHELQRPCHPVDLRGSSRAAVLGPRSIPTQARASPRSRPAYGASAASSG